jgi:hypothetical protein
MKMPIARKIKERKQQFCRFSATGAEENGLQPDEKFRRRELF